LRATGARTALRGHPICEVKLEDLIDLEAQIALDRDRDAEMLRRRDRQIFLDLDATGSRQQILAGWLARLRAEGECPALGERVQLGTRWARRVLVVFGALAGWGAGEALLGYREGAPPVNVGTFLLVVVGLQVALLLILAVGLPITRRFPNAPLFGDVRMLLRLMSESLGRVQSFVQSKLRPETRDRIHLAQSRLRQRSSLYAPVERWTLVGLTQLFGVAFNAGVLAACLRLVVFSDLAFGWSTTAEALDADTMHRVVRGIAAPWAELFPEAVPSEELVKQSRYYRLEGRYAHAPPGTKGDPALVGGWWPFLIAATLTYGLLPRFALLALAAVLRARALARVPLDTAEVERVLRRMTSPRVETRGSGVEGELFGHEAHSPREGPQTPRVLSGRSGFVVRWRQADAPRAAIERSLRESFGWSVRELIDADGAREVDLGAAAPESLGDPVVVVVAEAWEPPDKGIRNWIRRLRSRVGPSIPIRVVLVGEGANERLAPAAADDLAVWRDRLELLEDPHLGVVTLEAP